MKCCHQFRMLAVLCARAPPYTVATKSYGRTATSDAERRAAPRVRAETACQRTRARGGDRHVEVVSSVVFDSRLAPHGGARRTSASGSREQGTSPRPEPPSARTSNATEERRGRFARSGVQGSRSVSKVSIRMGSVLTIRKKPMTMICLALSWPDRSHKQS